MDTNKRHNPITFYIRVFLYMFAALLLRITALVPLAALFVFESGSNLRWLALLCPIMFLFVVIPLRYSFAEALVQERGSRYFSYDKAYGFASYGSKLCEGFLYILNILKYTIPLVVLAFFAKGLLEEAFITELLTSLTELGAKAKDIFYSVINFFPKLFGAEPLAYAAGGIVEGLYVVLGVVGLAVLILLIGIMRNSATRYIWALAERDNRPVRTEVRRRLRGRRIKQLLVALLNLLLLAPYFVILYLAIKPIVPDLSGLITGLMTGAMPEITISSKNILMVVGAFFGVYMTLLPARRILTAWFATKHLRHTAAVSDSTPEFISDIPERNYEENVDYNAAPADQGFIPQQSFVPILPNAVPIEGMTATTQMVNGQPQVVYVPNDSTPMPAAVVPDWVQAQNNGTAMPETPIIPASFLGNEQNGSNFDA